MTSSVNSLDGKVVIVTGAAGGIGAAIALRLAAEGAAVIATDILPNELALSKRIVFIQHDVTDAGGWDAVLAESKAQFGQVNALVNNAGIFVGGDIEATEASALEQAFRINQLGTFLGMKAIVEPLKAAGGGSIVNIASCVSMRGVADQFAYAASKWAVRGMTKCAALDLAKHNIRVNSINPGPTATPMTAAFSVERQAFLKSLIPLGRMGQPSDVATAAAFLIRDDAAYVSGTEIDVDGGVFA